MRKNLYILYSLLFFMHFCSCSFLVKNETVCIAVPNEGPYKNWVILVTSGGQQHEVKAEGGEKVFLSVQKNLPSSVLVFPEGFYESEDKTYHYGAIFPWCRHISKKQAFSADILRDFYEHSSAAGNSDSVITDYASRFNWEKFCLTLEKNFLEDENYNPWKLERRKILESIEAGKFSVSLLKNG